MKLNLSISREGAMITTMKKRILSLILTAIIIISAMPAALAENWLQLSVTANKTSAAENEEIAFTVSAKNLVDNEKLQFAFEYDDEKLEFVKSEFLMPYSYIKYASTKGGKVGVLIITKQAVSGDCDVVTLTFKVKDNANGGNLNYKISNILYGNSENKISGEYISTGAPVIEIVGQPTVSKFTAEIDKTSAKTGDIVTLIIKSNEEKLRGLELSADYPESIFKFKSASFADVIGNNAMMTDFEDSNGAVKVLFAAENDINVLGNIITLTFEVKDNAPSGNAIIDIKNIKAQSSELAFKVPDFSATAVTVSGNDAAVVLSADKTNTTMDGIINAFIGIDSSEAFRGMECILNFDSEVFEVGEIESLYDALASDYQKQADGTYKFVFASDTAITGNVDLFKIPLKAKKYTDATKITITNLKTIPENLKLPSELTLKVKENAFDADLKVSKSANEAAIGSEITYSFDIDGALQGLEFVVDYDSTKLKLIGTSEGLIENDDMNTNFADGKIKVLKIFDYSGTTVTKGKLMDLKFKVKDTATVGSANVLVSNVKSGESINVEQCGALNVYDGTVAANINVTPNKRIAAKGENVTYDIYLKTAENIGGMQMAFNFDSDILEFVSSDINSFDAYVKTCTETEDGKLGIAFTFDSERKVDEKLTAVTFKVKDSATKGLTDVVVNNAKITNNSGAKIDVNVAESLRIINRFSALEAISNVTSVNPGENIDVELWLKKADDAEGIQAKLEYDVNAFDFVSFEKSDFEITSGDFEESSNKLVYIFDTLHNDDAMKIGTLTLKAKVGVGNSEIKISSAEVPVTNGTQTHVRVPAEIKNLTVYVTTDADFAAKVIEKINAIGEVTSESGTAISDAENAYANLTSEQKALVTNYGTLTAAREKYNKIVTDEEAAQRVTDKINAIGEVTLESESTITDAESAYSALTDTQKALVTNYETLTAAREKYNQLYSDKVAVDNVVALIEAVGSANIDSLEAITKAEEEYAKLTDELKARVTNKEKLDEARKIYEEEKAAVENVIDLIGKIAETVTIQSKESIEQAETAYNALSDTQKAHVTNADILAARRTAFDAIKTITFETNGANKSVEPQYVNVGEHVTKPDVKKSGYTFKGWYTDSDFTKAWDFENDVVENDMTLYAKWNYSSTGGGGGGGGSSKGHAFVVPSAPKNDEEDKKSEDNKTEENKKDEQTTDRKANFADIENHWAKSSIEKLYAAGIVEGVSENAYEPDRTVTRAEFAAMLTRLLKLDIDAENIFDDVKENDWFYSAVCAAAKAEIVSGYDGRFRPNDNISRQEMAVMVSKSYDYLGLTQPELKGLDNFTDKDMIAQWAAPHVDKLTSAEIVNGYDDGTFKPHTNTTRAHAAVVVERLMTK